LLDAQMILLISNFPEQVDESKTNDDHSENRQREKSAEGVGL
jgi:hypothetical protein